MDLIKDVENLSKKIDELKQSIERYDNAFRSVDKQAIDKRFGQYKTAQAGAMSVDKLAQTVSVLSENYKDLVSSQEAAKSKMQQMTTAMKDMEQLQSTIAAAQREALSTGDQAGAAELYQRYVANGEAMQLMRLEMESTSAEIEVLDKQVAQHTQTLDRYQKVNEAASDTIENGNIDDLTRRFDTEKKKIQDISKALAQYKEKYDATKVVVDKGGLVVGGLEKSKEKLRMYADEISRLSNEYVIASERAQQYATALGNDDSGIPKVEMPKVEPEKVKQAAENMQEYAEHAGEASSNLSDMVKAGAKLGGLTYGVRKLQEFAQQVMTTRGEFQQLEVAFTTMLGNKGKAEALMQQLTRTAASTPFDLQSVSRGAKQLLAYGTAASDVNDILVHLGDIAAGLSQPLDALVYLYGTTMTQGKMMTMDLRQFQNRGIPIAEQLAKQFGVAKSEVQSLVSAGRVTADEFHKAVMGMASDGGRFAGLMSAQSKTITGQISNIQDSIDMMFNEIGKSSEGVINTALSGVSYLVENYENVGKTIMGLITAFGTYKAALIVASAIEAARNKQATFSVAICGRQVQMMNLLTKATWKQIAAQLKANAAAYANPYVAVAAALAAMVYVLINWNKWMEKAVSTTDKVNKKYDERISKINEEKDATEQHIAVLEDETSAYYEIMQAKDALSKMDLFKDKNISGMTPEQIREELKIAYDEQMAKAEEEQLQGYIASIEKGKKKYYPLRRKKIKDEIIDDKRDAVRGITSKEFNDFAVDKTLTEQTDFLTQKIQEQNAVLDDRNAKMKEYESLSEVERGRKYGSGYTDLFADWEYEFRMAELYKENYKQILDNINEQKQRAIDKDKEDNTGNTLAEIIGGYTTTDKDGKEIFVNGILQQEDALKKARQAYELNSSAANKKAIETAESALKDLTDKYKLATGESWVSTEEFIKAKEKEERDAARKGIEIAHQEYAKRVQLADKYYQDLEDLRLEEEEWEKKNKGRELPEYFSKKRALIEAQFTFDKEQLDKEFNEWIDGIERETYNIHLNIDLSEFDAAIESATTFAEKRLLQTAKYEQEYSQKEQDLDKDIEKAAKDQFGDKTITAYNRFKAGGGTWTEEEKATFEQMDKFYELQLQKRNALLEQMEQQHNAAMLQEDLQNFEEYADGILGAEEKYQNELAAIRERYELSEDTDIENSSNSAIRQEVAAAQNERDIAIASVEEKTGLKGNEYINRLVGLGEEIGNKTKEEIRALYQPLIEELDNKIAELKKEQLDIIQNAQANINSNQARIAEIDNALGGELSEDEQSALLTEKARLEGEITTYQQQQSDATARLNDNQSKLGQLVAARGRAEAIAAQNVAQADGKGAKVAKEQQKRFQKSVDALSAVKEIADDVANTFGGALSKKAKKALSAMSGIADFGISAIQGIETLVKGVSDGMIATTAGASKSLQALEKASFILTVISIAVQLITKIVEIVSQFTRSAQLQDSIDMHLEKVETLQRKNDELQRAYQNKTGVEYYQGMTKAAKQYEEVIREQNKALREATELYQLNRNRYGEDSDKTKDAKAQMEDIQDSLTETKEQQADMFAQVAEELATTDLHSFSQSLAESIVDGFEQGAEGIEDAFDDMLDDLYRAMLTKQLAMALEKKFEPIFKKIEERANDNSSLTESDIHEIMGDMEDAKNNAKMLAEAYYDVFSQAGLLEDADAEGSEGFGQMTQDQADTLTARFTAVQIEMANVSATNQAMAGVMSLVGEDIKLGVASVQSLLYNSNIALQIAQDQLDQMQAIADNTAMLAETNNRLKAIEQNTGRL